eukprot:GHVT01011002.1.p1 GENE.GHVT01011002.1~~GHVT01011002.1.p1  ORF type:complete len:126 (+),score=13.22 GHVT01011002.1:974-1351(+)
MRQFMPGFATAVFDTITRLCRLVLHYLSWFVCGLEGMSQKTQELRRMLAAPRRRGAAQQGRAGACTYPIPALFVSDCLASGEGLKGICGVAVSEAADAWRQGKMRPAAVRARTDVDENNSEAMEK